MSLIENKKIKLSNIYHSNNNNNNNQNNLNNYSNLPLHESLFWRIWRFGLLRNYILSFIKSSNYKYKIYKYDEIYSVPWIVDNSLGLLKDKVLKKEYLVFSDQLYYEEEDYKSDVGFSGSNIYYNGIGCDIDYYRYSKKKKTFFNLIRDDREFYYMLFKNYKEVFLIDYEFTFNLLLKYDCLVGFIVLKEIYNSNNSKSSNTNSSNSNNSSNNYNRSNNYNSINNYNSNNSNSNINNNNNNNNNNNSLIYNSNNYSKLLMVSVSYSSFDISKYLIQNYKFNINGSELWRLVLSESNDESIITKIQFIKNYLPSNISNMNITNFSLNLKLYKKKLRVLLDVCYLIESIKNQLDIYFQKFNYPLYSIENKDQFKMCILSKNQLDSLNFTNKDLEMLVCDYPSSNLAVRSLLEMAVPFTNKIIIKKNFQYLLLKYTHIQVEDQKLAKSLKVSEISLETLSKFGILPQQHYSINSLPSLFKYIRNDKEKKVRYIKIYIKRVLNNIERNHQYQQHQHNNNTQININQIIFENLLFIKDKDLFDIIVNLNNSFISIKRLFEITISKDILNYFKINYKNDYNNSLKVFLDNEFSQIRNSSLKLESLQFILENSQDFEIILSSNTGCNELLNKIETKNMELNQFKLFITNTTNEFKFSLEELYSIQLFKNKYYDAYFWIKENKPNQINRIVSPVTNSTGLQQERVNLLLEYYLNNGFNLPNDKHLFDDNIIIKIGESTGSYNLNILERIIKKYYISNNQQVSLIGKFENELVYKILQVSSKVGNIEVFKFIYNEYRFIFLNSEFISACKSYINNCFWNGHNEMLDFFFFSLGLQKYHSSIQESKYNEITRILFLNNHIKKSIFNNKSSNNDK